MSDGVIFAQFSLIQIKQLNGDPGLSNSYVADPKGSV